MTTKLLTAQAANGASEAVPTTGLSLTVLAAGTFDGASLKVQVSPDEGTTWIDTAVTLTAPGVTEVAYGNGVTIRLSLSSAGDETEVDAWVAYRRW